MFSMLEISLLSTTNNPVPSGTFFESTTDSSFSRLLPARAHVISGLLLYFSTKYSTTSLPVKPVAPYTTKSYSLELFIIISFIAIVKINDLY